MEYQKLKIYNSDLLCDNEVTKERCIESKRTEKLANK